MRRFSSKLQRTLSNLVWLPLADSGELLIICLDSNSCENLEN
uniref:Uncharacterized protein n=1 Tax=uncultured marine microorganism HF4000_ANIW137I15 TaxID=455531 RepID=B3T4M2_9ZZZZ|nr:hypothetical protein ALOHA_HF4000ANIW137I15ctg3g21 [uncultured marine microorganism HF4000_ANIW137I15]